MTKKQNSYNDYLEQQLKNPDFKKEWDKGEATYQVTRELIRARLQSNLSQRDLAKKAGTTQAVISRIENMNTNPSVDLLQRLAASMGRKLEIKFV